jgi:hypothetical protein
MSQESDQIVFNKYILEIELNKNKDQECQINNNIIFSYIPEIVKCENNEKYFANIKNNNEHYIGVLTANFNKELFGYILINQGDEYLGQILKEKKNGFGIYKFNNKKEKEKDIFIGNFIENNINGEGIYINILNNENSDNNSSILNKYNCYIGIFENGIFKKGKIYSVDNGFEKLEFKDDEKEENNLEEKIVVNYERKNDLNLYKKGKNKNKILIEGLAIYFNDNEEIENKFSFKLNNNLQYDFKYLEDKTKEKELIEEFKKSNFLKYKITIQDIFTKIGEMIDKMKNDFKYGKNLIIEDNFKKNFDDDYKLLIN